MRKIGRAVLAIAALWGMACVPAASRSGSGAASSADVAKIPLSDFGTGIAITPDGSRAYVAGIARVSVIDTSTNQVATTIDVGDNPYTIAISPDGARAYTVDLMERELWVLDLTQNKTVKRTWLGRPKNPVLRPGIAVSRDGTRVFVSTSQPEAQGNDNLLIVDAATGEVVKDNVLSFHPGQLATGPDPSLVYVTGCTGLCSDGSFHVIDPSRTGSLSTVGLRTLPSGIALSSDGSRAWIANAQSATVQAVDVASRSVVATVSVQAGPLGVALSPDDARVYVTNFNAGTLSVIDVASESTLANVPIGPGPRAIAITPNGRYAYVTHSESIVSVVDLSRVAP